ncbi:MAG: hypothetical protein JW700_00535 [Candidatus Aenigmarchaeota archaeon]|nr:hypothetical protein [Candidatus Aenigmarchaeota archaeon]
MKQKCRHDVKIEIMVKLFKPTSVVDLKKEMKMTTKRMNRILDELFERKLIRKLSNKDGSIIYHTTPKGRNIVKLYKDLTDHLEGEDVLPHVFGVYR